MIISLMIVAFVSCTNNDTPQSESTSQIKVSLTDAPGDYEEVNIEVLDVKVKNSDDISDTGWVSIGNVTPKIYNLLELTGGVTDILAENQIPSGYLGQIRLVLGENNSVKIGDDTYPLQTPSAQHSGLKLKVNTILEPNIAYKYLIDFDVDKSIVSTGSGKYILKPVMRLITEAVSGSIKGTIVAGEYKVLASVSIPGSIVTAYADSNGVFYLHGIPAGTYTVTLTPDAASGLMPKIIENVTVVNGITTDTGTTVFL